MKRFAPVGARGVAQTFESVDAASDASLHRAELGGDHRTARSVRGLARGGLVIECEQCLAQRLVEALGRLELDEVADAVDHGDVEAGGVLAVDVDRVGCHCALMARIGALTAFIAAAPSNDEKPSNRLTATSGRVAHIPAVTHLTSSASAPGTNIRGTAIAQVRGEVLAVGLAHFVDLLALHARLDVLQRVDHDHARHRGAEPARRFERDGSSHRMTDQHHVLEAELAHHGGDVVPVLLDGPGRAGPGRLAVTGQIDRDHGVVGGEHWNLLAPVVAIAGPTMDEHERRS